MKILTLMLLLFPLISWSQKDFNFEFVTSADAAIHSRLDTVTNVKAAIRRIEYHLPCRIIKHYNQLMIVSPTDYSNVRYQGDVTFVGVRQPFRGWMEYRDEKGNLIQIDPVRQLVRIYDGLHLKAQYGTSKF